MKLENTTKPTIEFQGYSSILESVAKSYGLVADSINHSSGLTVTQYRILLFLIEYGNANLKELAKKLRLKRNTVSVAASQLERHGWVARDEHIEDKRVVVLFATIKALNQIETVDQGIDKSPGLSLTPSSLELISSYVRPDEKWPARQNDCQLVFSSLCLSILDTLYKMITELIKSAGNISLTHYRILLRADSDRRLCLAELAMDLCLKPTSISEALIILQRRSLVERIESSHDSRSAWLEITAQGVACLNLVETTLCEIWGELFMPFAWLQISQAIQEYLENKHDDY